MAVLSHNAVDCHESPAIHSSHIISSSAILDTNGAILTHKTYASKSGISLGFVGAAMAKCNKVLSLLIKESHPQRSFFSSSTNYIFFCNQQRFIFAQTKQQSDYECKVFRPRLKKVSGRVQHVAI